MADKEVGWYKSQVPFEKWNDVCKFGVRTVQPSSRGFDFFFIFLQFRFIYYLLLVPTNAHTYIKTLNYITKSPTCFE
jgi:hypothetical protein